MSFPFKRVNYHSGGDFTQFVLGEPVNETNYKGKTESLREIHIKLLTHFPKFSYIMYLKEINTKGTQKSCEERKCL